MRYVSTGSTRRGRVWSRYGLSALLDHRRTLPRVDEGCDLPSIRWLRYAALLSPSRYSGQASGVMQGAGGGSTVGLLPASLFVRFRPLWSRMCTVRDPKGLAASDPFRFALGAVMVYTSPAHAARFTHGNSPFVLCPFLWYAELGAARGRLVCDWPEACPEPVEGREASGQWGKPPSTACSWRCDRKHRSAV